MPKVLVWAKNADIVWECDEQVKVQNSPVWCWQGSRWNAEHSIWYLCRAKYWTEETNKNNHKSKNQDCFEGKYWKTWLILSQEEGLWSEWRREEGSIYSFLYTHIFIYNMRILVCIYVQIQDTAKRKKKYKFCLHSPKDLKWCSRKKIK